MVKHALEVDWTGEMDADAFRVYYGEVIYGAVETVAKSGLSRTVRLFVDRDDRLVDITSAAADAMGVRTYTSKVHNGRAEVLRIKGVGMSATFEAVYRLGLSVYWWGYAFTHHRITSDDPRIG